VGKHLLEELPPYIDLTTLERSFLETSQKVEEGRIAKEKAEAERQAKKQAESTQTRSSYSSGGVGSNILLDGSVVHFESLGRGKPVIFLHGWIGSWQYWLNSMQVASSSFRSYALDLWGFGGTAHNVLNYSLEQQSVLLDRFLSEMGIGKIALVGHGLGALVGMKFANRFPQSVDRLMAISCPLHIDAVHSRLRTGSPKDLTDWLSPRTTEAITALSEASKADGQAITASLVGLQADNLYGSFRNLNIPCLLVYGERDYAVSAPDESFSLSTMTHPVFFERSGHFPMIDDRNRFEQLLMKFLRLNSGQSPAEIQL
jgi:pimeloyl-ACP methyl ester carboxylesterase